MALFASSFFSLMFFAFPWSFLTKAIPWCFECFSLFCCFLACASEASSHAATARRPHCFNISVKSVMSSDDNCIAASPGGSSDLGTAFSWAAFNSELASSSSAWAAFKDASAWRSCSWMGGNARFKNGHARVEMRVLKTLACRNGLRTSF